MITTDALTVTLLLAAWLTVLFAVLGVAAYVADLFASRRK